MVLGGALALAPLMPARSQLPGPVGGAVGDVVGGVGSTIGNVAGGLNAGEMTRPVRALARDWLSGLLRGNPAALEADEQGLPVVRGQVIAIAPTDAALGKAIEAGFAVRQREVLEGLGVAVVTLGVPEGASVRQAIKRLRQLDPAGQYAPNHIYAPSGRAAHGGAGAAPAESSGGAARIGLVDTGVAAHPVLDGLIAEQRGFAPGSITPASHGTAVASLLVGRASGFSGAAPGQKLLVADVYGNGPTGGSAEALARALGWMAVRQAQVVNISLVGPPNLLVHTAVAAMQRQGRLLVAAVGNDGPAAAPLYPAAYPGVVAVTGVDARNKVLPEAGRGTHVDFAAPGAGLKAASASGGYITVRGTSFAAPLVAGRLAMIQGKVPDRLEALARRASDLGRKGVDPVYGRGLICGECRNMVNKTN